MKGRKLQTQAVTIPLHLLFKLVERALWLGEGAVKHGYYREHDSLILTLEVRTLLQVNEDNVPILLAQPSLWDDKE